MRDALTPYIDSGDELLLVDLTGYGAGKGFDNECSSWLKKYLQFGSADSLGSAGIVFGTWGEGGDREVSLYN